MQTTSSYSMTTSSQIIADFDELADLVEPGESGVDHYDVYLVSLIPRAAHKVLDIGCGLGRLSRSIATPDRQVVGVDISPRMIQRARSDNSSSNVSFIEGDFMTVGFDGQLFDCVISAAAVHHMSYQDALPLMCGLLRPGGRLIIHDLRRDASMKDLFCSSSAFGHVTLQRFLNTGQIRQPKHVREAWERHGAHEKYLSIEEARELAKEYLPGAKVNYHWLWRYTIVWEKPSS
jgi:2-polyprenyl-3-methyl-5-hydroxy-6-metoxy-1,4-benzoquinol methylase